jgi:hypothetical protein
VSRVESVEATEESSPQRGLVDSAVRSDRKRLRGDSRRRLGRQAQMDLVEEDLQILRGLRVAR